MSGDGEAGTRPGARVPRRGELARRGRAAGRRPGAQPHDGVGGAGGAAAGRGRRGADPDGIPWVNRLVDAVVDEVGLGARRVALPVFDALAAGGPDAADLDAAGAEGGGGQRRGSAYPLGKEADRGPEGGAAGDRDPGLRTHRSARAAERDRLIKRYGDLAAAPWIYLIVATGDIYEDIPQAQAAARAGADVIAVIRSTGQSLLDYVPEGATRGGFAGTYATQENFRLMRAAPRRDVAGGRPVCAADQLRVRAVHAGDARPAGLERLDMMLNDSMYGILFRDINPIRTFVDQRFSRQVHARPGSSSTPARTTTSPPPTPSTQRAHGDGLAAAQRVFRARGGLADWQLGWATRSRSTRTCRSRSGSSSPTRCWPRAVPGRAAEVRCRR